MSIDAYLHGLHVSRKKKRETLDMIPMSMGQEQVQFRRARRAGRNIFTHLANSRTGVANKNSIAKPHFDARGIASINSRPTRGSWNRTPGTPKFNKGSHV